VYCLINLNQNNADIQLVVCLLYNRSYYHKELGAIGTMATY
jgi:hypothetical protein